MSVFNTIFSNVMFYSYLACYLHIKNNNNNNSVIRGFVCINQIPKRSLNFSNVYSFLCFYGMLSKLIILQSPDNNNILDSCSARSHSNIQNFVYPKYHSFQMFPLLPTVKPIIGSNCVLWTRLYCKTFLNQCDFQPSFKCFGHLILLIQFGNVLIKLTRAWEGNAHKLYHYMSRSSLTVPASSLIRVYVTTSYEMTFWLKKKSPKCTGRVVSTDENF